MGSAVVSICGKTDFFKDLIAKYGEDFLKLILSEKAKMELQKKFIEIKEKIKAYVEDFVMKVN